MPGVPRDIVFTMVYHTFYTGDLSSYELVKEYGATKLYQVTEQKSKVVFDVTFYFYGGIFSGWRVEPEELSYNKYVRGII